MYEDNDITEFIVREKSRFLYKVKESFLRNGGNYSNETFLRLWWEFAIGANLLIKKK